MTRPSSQTARIMATTTAVVLSTVLLTRPDIGLSLGLDVEVDESKLSVSGEAVQVSAGIYINSQVSEMQCSMSATATLALREEIVEVVPRNIGSVL